jgi:hypothetical protein
MFDHDKHAQDMFDAEIRKIRKNLKISVFVFQGIIGLIWGLLNGLLPDTATVQLIINIGGLLIAGCLLITNLKLMNDVDIKYPVFINTGAFLFGVVVVRSVIDMFL